MKYKIGTKGYMLDEAFDSQPEAEKFIKQIIPTDKVYEVFTDKIDKADGVMWVDYDSEIAIRIEKSDYTDNKLLITVNIENGETEIDRLLVDVKELIGWE